MEKIGAKIRSERKKSGLTLEQFARKIGISPITLQRIETGKSSPSVVLLSEIAQNVNKPIYSFFEETGKPLIYIKRKNQRLTSSSSLKVRVIAPRKMIADNIVVTYGELKKGRSIDPHQNPGVEWAYVVEGRCEFKQDNQNILLEAGDSLVHNARLEHSVKALENLKFFGIYVEDKG